MLVNKIDEELSIKLIELKDGESIFELTNNSRNYLRKWLPWLDYTTNLVDTRILEEIILSFLLYLFLLRKIGAIFQIREVMISKLL